MDGVILPILASLGDSLSADRAYVVLVRGGEYTFVHEWRRVGVAPTQSHLRAGAISRYPQILSRARALPSGAFFAAIDDFSGAERALLAQDGVLSLGVAPLRLSGAYLGHVGVGFTSARPPASALHESLLSTVASSFSAAFSSFFPNFSAVPILSIATSLPTFALSLPAAIAALSARYPPRHPLVPKIPALLTSTTIANRYLTYADPRKNSNLLGEKAEMGEAAAPSFFTAEISERMRRYAAAARRLCVLAAMRAMSAARVGASEISLVCVASSTGFLGPGLDAELVRELGLGRGVQRQNVGFMGCAAAFHALEVARAHVLAYQTKYSASQAGERRDAFGGGGGAALVVAVEVSSASDYVAEDMGGLILQALFADGCAAAVMGKGGGGSWEEIDEMDKRLEKKERELRSELAEKPDDMEEEDGGEDGSFLGGSLGALAVDDSFKSGDLIFNTPGSHLRAEREMRKLRLLILHPFSALLPNSEDGITLSLHERRGVTCVLSRALPDYIRSGLASVVYRSLKSQNLTREDIRHWAIHPGGPAIIRACEDALQLSKAQTEISWRVLGQYGNMLSPTVLFVLEKMMVDVNTMPGLGLALSFSPGVGVEGFIFEIQEVPK